MCGIIGYIGKRKALNIILDGLAKLEYRGYDSSGVALCADGEFKIVKREGKLSALKEAVSQRTDLLNAHIGIGHTRWATHGKPTEVNAHPHMSGRVALIHNGIIENYLELKRELESLGYNFVSETDTEIAVHLLNYFLDKQSLSPLEAMQKVVDKIRGSYAFVVLDKKHPDLLLVAKNNTPIVIGYGDNENFVASDIPGLLSETKKVSILEDGDIAIIRNNAVDIYNKGSPVNRETIIVSWDPISAQKGGFKHYMLKEIYEQGNVIGETFRDRINPTKGSVFLPELDTIKDVLLTADKISLVACGTAWHASLVMKFYVEMLAKTAVEVDYASEFRYRDPILKNTLVGAISQSGETADTLAALLLAKEQGCSTFAICNVIASSIARAVDSVIYTHAGPEISVASTKAFTTQLVAGLLFALSVGEIKETVSFTTRSKIINDMLLLPSAIDSIVSMADAIYKIANLLYSSSNCLYLGRGLCYPIALEGALKLKEISYIHAEGYPAGEMKHGPIALIDENMPVIFLVQRDEVVFEKIISNLKEVESRRGKVIVVTDIESGNVFSGVTDHIIKVPYINKFMSPILMTVPLQLLAYYIAVFKGTDVDLPRNLAKSVTVE